LKELEIVMAMGGQVFGGCGEGTGLSALLKNGDDLLCCGWKWLSFIWGVKVRSTLALEVGDGARYRILFRGFWGCLDKERSLWWQGFDGLECSGVTINY
jgi:hypothetical protein